MPEEPGQCQHTGTGVGQSHPCSCKHQPAAPAEDAPAQSPLVNSIQAGVATGTAVVQASRLDFRRPTRGTGPARGAPAIHVLECTFLL